MSALADALVVDDGEFRAGLCLDLLADSVAAQSSADDALCALSVCAVAGSAVLVGAFLAYFGSGVQEGSRGTALHADFTAFVRRHQGEAAVTAGTGWHL